MQEMISVSKKSSNLRIVNTTKVVKRTIEGKEVDYKEPVSFAFREGEQFVPKDIYNIIKDVPFFKEQVQIGELTVNEPIKVDVVNIDIKDKYFSGKVLAGMKVIELQEKMPNIKDVEALQRLIELETRPTVVKMAEARLNDLVGVK